jgi:hypothetical protein
MLTGVRSTSCRQRPVQGSHPPDPAHNAGRLRPLPETARRPSAPGKTTTPGPLRISYAAREQSPAISIHCPNRIIRRLVG